MDIMGKRKKGYKSVNQMQSDIYKGKLPKTIRRSEIDKKINGQDHVHLKDGRALYRDGTFKH